VAVVATACDESFGPIEPSELGFSVFGYLDASADTQWIRVMPIRPLTVTSQDSLGATVTIEHLGTGRIVELRDSLFSFSTIWDPILGSEGTYLHNFWTLEDIEPGASYRFSARREGKEPAEAVVEIPGDYEVEVAINQYYGYDSLRITGVKHVPFVTMIAHFYDLCGSSVAWIQYKTRWADDEPHVMAIGRFPSQIRARPGCGVVQVIENWELWIVGSEAAWPAGGYSPSGLGESGWTSNVTNAVGFLGGVLTKVIPYEDCEFQSHGAPVPHYCLLRYNPETATLSGTVSETRCGDGPIDSVTVQLTEMDREPARIRTVLSNQAGEFLIGALEPGIPHLLRASTHTDTLTFTPGQQVEYDIDLPCSEPPPGAQ
jgi:hypothetical protein